MMNGDGGIVSEYEGVNEIQGEVQADTSALRDVVAGNRNVVKY